MSDDPFSDVLRVTETTSVVSGGVAAGGAWALHVPRPNQVIFCAIVKGACWLRLDGHTEAVELEQGDVGLLTGRTGFVLASALSVKPTEAKVSDHAEWGEMTTIGDGSGCTWLVGRVSLHASNALLLTEALPPLLHVRASTASSASLRWVLNELFEEQTSRVPGSKFAAAQLAQLFFVKILRAHVAGGGASPAGWLRAVGDERIARALRLIHAEPQRPFRLEQLAKAAGMSRTRFAVQFRTVSGVAPLAYLTRWRMYLAQEALRETDRSMIELADSLGYASESAFSTAFKRVTGTSPRAYRQAARPSGATDVLNRPRRAGAALR